MEVSQYGDANAASNNIQPIRHNTEIITNRRDMKYFILVLPAVRLSLASALPAPEIVERVIFATPWNGLKYQNTNS